MLNLKDALQLYALLKEFLPSELPDNLYDFTGKIIQNISHSSHPENFGAALILMTGKSVAELDKLDTADRIELFIIGLKKNKFLSLVEFCKSLGL